MATRDLVWRWWSALRLEGIPLDVRQLESAIRVADALETSSREDRLLGTIEGIFAKNEREVDLFRRIAARDSIKHDEDRSEWGRPINPARRGPSKTAWAGFAAGLLVLASLTGWQLWTRMSRTPPVENLRPGTSEIVSDTAMPMVQRAGLQAAVSQARLHAAVSRPRSKWAAFVKALMVAVPLLVVAALILWSRRNRPEWARLTLDAAEDRLTNNLPAPDENFLFPGNGLQSFAAALKVQTDEPSERIDVRRTVEATADHAGLLQVVWHPRPIDSPVHLAIERRSREDHVSELYFRLCDKLRDNGAEVGASHYRDDLARRRDEEGTLMGRPRLDPWETRALLVIVGEGDAMFEATATEPNAKRLQPTEAWPRRALLSTRSVALWGSREERLGAAVMAVAPGNMAGVRALAERLAARQPLRGIFGARRLR